MLVSLLLLALPCWALAMDDSNTGGDDAAMTASSTAAGDWDAGCLTVPNGCSIDCVGIELACCKNPCSCECEEGKQATLRVEFMGEDGAVLATGNVTNNWCNPCPPCRTGPLATFGSLDNPIDPCAIKTARLSVVDGPEAGINVKSLVLWVRDPQGRLGVCEKWYKAWKCHPECCQVLGGGTAWTFTSNGCCKQACGSCNKCENKCGCNKCESKCSSCNKCGTSKCGCNKCASKCNTCAAPKCGCSKCGNKCSSCSKCGTAKCGCDKCASKCDSCAKPKCDSCAKPACGCNKCATTKCGCNKCDKCSAKPACGCSKCGSKCNTCNKCGEKKCGCSTCGH